MESIREILRLRLETVESRIQAACVRADRPRAAVHLIAVTKTVSLVVARELAALGVHDLGESRPQELWHKAEALPEARWHLIGHLQRNKIERTVPLVHRIHSVDSLRLLTALDEHAREQNRPIAVLLEVNASQEASKQGFAPAEVPDLVDVLHNLRAVSLHGLMTMAAYSEDPQTARPTFHALAQLRQILAERLSPERHPLSELSMGMSNDFEVAIEEGATWIRIGTVLFEGLE